MAKSETKIKRISVNAIKDIYEKELPSSAMEINWKGLRIEIKRFLPFPEALAFVHTIEDMCFPNGTGSYMPEMEDFVKRVSVIDMYTNITLPSDSRKKYEIVYNLGLYEKVIENIDKVQFDALCDSAHRKIEHKASGDSERFGLQLNEVMNKVENISDYLSNVFKGISGTEISKLIEGVANGQLDEGKLVKAYKEEFITDKESDKKEADKDEG